jgi:hypothetical protein
MYCFHYNKGCANATVLRYTYIGCIFQGFQECDKQYVITEDGKNVSHISEDKHSHSSQCFLQFFEEFIG